jgi:hypothetical protein
MLEPRDYEKIPWGDEDDDMVKVAGRRRDVGGRSGS